MRRAVLALALAAAAAPARAGVPPRYGGTVRVAVPAPPRVLDPARALAPEDLLAVRALHAPLLEVDAAGRLVPGLLAEVPVPDAAGRTFRLRLRPGATFADGAPVTAWAAAAALVRTLGAGSPHAWIAAPIAGADAVLAGRAGTLSGVAIASDQELVVTLAFPLPDFPWALAAPAASPVSGGGAGAGPFRLAGPASGGGALRLVANDRAPRGRPFADALVLAPETARGAADALARGGVELVVRPEPASPAARDLAPGSATYAVVNRARLGASAGPLRAALAGVDRAALARRFVRGPATPLATLLPPFAGAPIGPAPTAARAPAGAPPAGVTLLVQDGAADQRAVAERLQVLLFDRGIRVAVERADAAAVADRIARGDFQLALVPVTFTATRPALAAAQVALAAGGPRLARRALQLVGAAAEDQLPRALDALADEAGIVPLFATGLRATPAPALQGLAPRPDGAFDLGDLWLLPAVEPAPASPRSSFGSGGAAP